MDPWSMGGGQPPGYPTMPNQYGIGTQSMDSSGQGSFGASAVSGGPAGPTAGAASNPAYGAQPLTSSAPDTSSRGFNPWSLTGEANARGN